MKNITILLAIIILLFSCKKNITNNVENIEPDGLSNIERPLQSDEYSNIFIDQIMVVESTKKIENIRNFILNDLNINKKFFTIDELLIELNIIENNKIEIQTSQNMHYNEVLDYFYLIESEQYKIELFKNEFFTDYRIITFEININEKYYLNLFPYLTMEEYITSNDFDRINNIRDNIIEYMIDTEAQNEYCYLIFENGFIKSFRIAYYFT